MRPAAATGRGVPWSCTEPGGMLPLTHTTSAAGARSTTCAARRAQSSEATGGPGSLITVASCDCPSIRIMQVRVSRSIHVQAAPKPSCSANSAMSRPLCPPANPVHTTVLPSVRATRATFRPLPPAATSELVVRCGSPSRSVGTVSVRSTAGLGVTQRIIAPTVLRPGLAGRRCPRLPVSRASRRRRPGAALPQDPNPAKSRR